MPYDRAAARERYFQLLHDRPESFVERPGGIVILRDPEAIAAVEVEVAARYASGALPDGWPCVGVVDEDPWHIVLRDAVRFPDGKVGVHLRVVMRSGDPAGIAVLARLQGDVVLVRQFRHAVRDHCWECPRGGIESGQDPEQAARTELREELGADLLRLDQLGRMHGASSLVGSHVVLAYAEIDRIGTPPIGEGISELGRFTPDQVERMICAGEITDSFTVAAFFHARSRGLV